MDKALQPVQMEVDLMRHNIELTGRNRIKFDFSSISYSSQTVIFSYMLEGADNNWSTGSGNNVVYQNLPKGNYIFKLRARKATSAWSKPIEFRIIIEAQFWQQPVFVLLLFLVISGLVSIIIIWRKNLQIKRREIDYQLITLEQKALQSMMNPHFIFNALGSIQNFLLQKKAGEAGLYLAQFARLIRQNLNSINSATIILEDEIERLKNYLDLEKLRMQNKFEYFIHIDENMDEEEAYVPSMIIQPFIENSIWHGISGIEEKGEIIINFSMPTKETVMIIIEDNGIGIQRAQTYSSRREKHIHMGVNLTKKRLEIIGKKFHVETCVDFYEKSPESPNPDTRVIIIVPSTKEESQ